MAGKLREKRERFVAEYLIDLNAAAAYRRAGYAVKNDNVAAVEGHRLLTDPKVAVEISEALRKRQERTEITADYVIKGLIKEAERDDENSSHSARVAALSHLGKHLGMFIDRHQISGGVSIEYVIGVEDEEDGEAPDQPAGDGGETDTEQST